MVEIGSGFDVLPGESGNSRGPQKDDQCEGPGAVEATAAASVGDADPCTMVGGVPAGFIKNRAKMMGSEKGCRII
jgi:hypothetical protein